jgi:hypothetical protein
MVVISVMLVMLTTLQVFLWILVEGRFAPGGAEIICRPVVFGFPLGSFFINFHFTYRINRHWISSPFTDLWDIANWFCNPANRTSTGFVKMIVAEIP